MQHNRNRRALNFVADIGHLLFGFARDSDLIKFHHALLKVDAKAMHNTEQIHTLAEDMQSFSKAVNYRFNNVSEHIITLDAQYENVTYRVQYLYTKLDQRIHKLEVAYVIHGALIVDVMKLGIQNNLLYHEYHGLVNEQMQGVSRLVHENKLSPLLVSPVEISKLFDHITKHLQENYPRYKIAVSDPNILYQTPGIAYTWDDDFMYIQVRIPIAAYNSKYKVYEVMSMPLPIVSNDTSSLTKINNVPELVAINQDHDFYFELSKSEYDQCLGYQVKYCLKSFPIISSNIPTCIFGIISNNYKMIKTHCKVSYIKSKEPIQLLQPVTSSTYLSITQKEDVWYLNCENQGPKQIEPVTFGLFTLQCDCSLRTLKYFLPPTIDNCQINTNFKIQVNYLTNLLYLIKYVDHSQLISQNLSSEMTRVVYPNIKQKYNKHKKYVQPSQDLEINLDDVIESTKQNKDLYHNVISDLEEQTSDLTSDTAGHGLLIFGILAFVSILSILIIYLCCKYKSMSSVINTIPIVASQMATKASAYVIDNHNNLLPEHGDSLMFCMISIITFILVSYIITKVVMTISKYMISKYFKGYKVSNNETSLILELISKDTIILIPLCSVVAPSSELLLYSPLLNLSWDYTSAWYNPRLNLNWANTVIIQHPYNSLIQLPTSIPIAPWLQIELTKFLKDPLNGVQSFSSNRG